MSGLKELLPYLKKYRSKIYLGFFFITISNIAAAIAPRVVGNTIDIISRSQAGEQVVLLNILLFLALTAVSGVFSYLTRQQVIVSSRLIEYDICSDFLLSIERRPMDFFHRNPVGTLMAYATNDIPATRDFLGPAVMFSANSITMFLFSLVFMLSINIPVTLLALAPLPLMAISTYFIGGKIHSSFKDVQAQFADMTSYVQESFSGISIIKAYVRKKHEEQAFHSKSRQYYEKNMKLARYQAIIIPAIMALVGSSMIIVIAFGGALVIENELTLGEITQFIIYLSLLIWPIASIGWITNLVQRASASAARLASVLSEKADEETIDIPPSSELPSGDIIFRNVSLIYPGSKQPALDNINAEIRKGSLTGIIGRVGSGKTSFINLIPRLFTPSTGTIKIGGKNILDIPMSQLRLLCGIVTQEPFLFSATIAENIAFGKYGATIEEVEEAAKQSCVHDEITSFPDGYNSILGERGITLSGGQKQRVAIARALVRKPEILILDDSLSSVDTSTEAQILANLREFTKDMTTITISHRISTLLHSDNILVFKDGRIAESGSHTTLLNMKEIYFEIYEQQKIEQELNML